MPLSRIEDALDGIRLARLAGCVPAGIICEMMIPHAANLRYLKTKKERMRPILSV